MHTLEFRALDVSSQTTTAAFTVEDDNGVRRISAAEAKNGISVSPGDELTVRATAKALWPVEQKLQVAKDRIERVKPNDPFAWLTLRGPGTSKGRVFTFTAWMTLFRDAWPDAEGHGWSPIPGFSYHLFNFAGSQVLADGSQSKTGWKRMHGALAASQKSADAGFMWFLKAPTGAGVPGLVAVFQPSGVNPHKPANIHTFFCPKTSGKTGVYPYASDFKSVFNNYMVGKGKRLLNQHVASGRKAFFVFPMPPPAGYFSGIDKAADLRSYLLQVVHFVRRQWQQGKKRLFKPELGHCVLSGFSAAGTPLAKIMKSSRRSEFDELKEVYALDVIPNKVTEIGITAAAWLGAEGRRLRIYVGKYDALGERSKRPPFAKGAHTRESHEAKEWERTNATYFFAPTDFWNRLHPEQLGDKPNPEYTSGAETPSTTHQLIPRVMLTHALNSSGLP